MNSSPKADFREGKKSTHKYLECLGVRVSPKVLVFRNAYEGKTYSEKITLQNVSQKQVIIRTGNPSSYSFKLEKSLQRTILACGLTCFCRIIYVYSSLTPVLRAELPIYVDDNVFNYEMIVIVSSGIIIPIPRNIDFGTVNAGHSGHVQTLELHNRGYRTTKFEIDLANQEFDIVFKPNKGFIPARGFTAVKVNVIAFQEGTYFQEIWIKCDHPFRVPVSVKVIIPKLYVCSPKDVMEIFTPIVFPPIYAACRSNQSLIFLNHSTLKSLYVVVPEYRNEIMNLKKVLEIEPKYGCFHLSPVDGNLEPNERSKLNICFAPIPVKTAKEDIYFVFFRIVRIDCLDVEKIVVEPSERKSTPVVLPDDDLVASDLSKSTLAIRGSNDSVLNDSSSSGSDDKPDVKPSATLGDYIRICLFAVVKPVEAEIEPQELSLGTMVMNDKIQREVTLRNNSTSLPIYFKYKKIAFVEVEPSKGFLKTQESTTVIITISPRAPGVLNMSVTFDLLYDNYPRTYPQELVAVGNVAVDVMLKVQAATIKIQPKFTMGITPLITNEVGLLPNDIRFTDTDVAIPKAAIAGFYLDKSMTDLDSAIIAFPNDRPGAVRPWANPNAKYRTIFAGLERPRCIADKNMLTKEENKKKVENKTYYDMYLKKLAEAHPQKRVIDTRNIDYDVSETKLLMIQHVASHNIGDQLTGTTVPVRAFSFLTPIQIFFVKILPTCLNTGKVAVRSKSKYKITIENGNTFPVKIIVKAHNSDLASSITNLPQSLYLGSFKKSCVEIEFRPTSPGRFNAILGVVINDIHYISVPFKSEVVVPSITLESNEIVTGGSCPHSTKHINVHNTLNIPVEFKWYVPDGSCFTVLPKSGFVPSNRFITCELYYTPNNTGRTTMKLCIVCDQGLAHYVNVSACMDKCDVEILEPKMHFMHVPLNVKMKKINILRNFSYEQVVFTIKNKNPFPGVVINPGEGVIPGRADFYLTVTVHIQAMIEFECKVEIGIICGTNLEFTIHACVECGVVSFRPAEIFHVKRVAAESLDVFPFVVENKGSTPVHLTFAKDVCPDITISRSMQIDKHTYHNVYVDLEVGESANLYLIFAPLDVSCNDILLPYIINDIVGPPIKDKFDSVDPGSYLNDYNRQYDYEDNCKFVANVKRIPSISLLLVATRHILRFSKTFIRFKYFPVAEYHSTTSTELRIKNTSRTSTEFCIRIDDLEPIFSITCKQGANVQFTETAVMSTLEQEEEINLIVQFKQKVPGSYLVNLPIFIRNYEYVFNYLQLSALYPRASFSLPLDMHLQHIPLNATSTHDLPFKCLHHLNGCVISVNSSIPSLVINLPEECLIPQSAYLTKDITAQLMFSSDKPISFFTGVRVWCTCGAESIMKITGCADESTVTTHIFLYGFRVTDVGGIRSSLQSGELLPKLSTISRLMPFKISLHQFSFHKPSLSVTTIYRFPYFPSDSDTSTYSKYMHEIGTIVEKWLYHQIFYCNCYITIPEQMNKIYDFSKKPRSTNAPTNFNVNPNPEEPSRMLILVKIIVNILGPQVLQYLVTREIPVDGSDLDRVICYHDTYSNCLKFLTVNGATFPHVKPKYLLSYTDYLLYVNKLRIMLGKSKLTPYPYSKFYARSKQCWIDVILQIFKSLVLSRIGVKSIRESRISIFFAKEPESPKTNPETILLHWLDTNFENQREAMLQLNNKIFPESVELKPRKIENFTSDLSDGLVFIAVTIAYCPYLSQYLKNVYLYDITPERAFHNAAQLILSWKMIKCSFLLTPLDITEPSAVQMIMFVAYMYDTFPSLVPRDVIEFRVSLSRTEEKELLIENNNTLPLYYNVVYLNNASNSFSLRDDKLVIAPKKTVKVKIIFQAKKITQVKATMILCGDTMGQVYSKSVAYSLIGSPDFSEELYAVNFSFPLYTINTKNVEVKAPYPGSVTYDIWFTFVQPEVTNFGKIYNWKDHLNVIRPRWLFSEQTNFVSSEKGTGIMHVTVYAMANLEQHLWLFFVNKEIGDFFIKLIYQPLNTLHVERINIPVEFPPNWATSKCTCTKQHGILNKCPRILNVKIPCRNDQFWNVVSDSILSAVDGTEEDLWTKYLDAEVGPYIIQWLSAVNQTTLSKNMFNVSQSYTVITNNHDVEFPEKIVIENTRSHRSVEIYVHVKEEEREKKKSRGYVDFSLISENGEIRLFRLGFKTSTKNIGID